MTPHPGVAWPGARTRLAALIGSPVEHSLSPAIHNAAFAAAGLDWAFVAFDVTVDAVGEALAGAWRLGIAGLSVTMPLKTAVAGSLRMLTPQAALLEAVNTVTPGPDGLVGDNTDGAGLLDALRLGPHQFDASGRHCVVVGAGGAARSVIAALAGAGAAEVVVVNRTLARAEAAAALAGATGRVGTVADIGGADLVVNATSVGMAGTESVGVAPFDPKLVRPGQLVADLVYHPVRTPLLAAAAGRGASTVDGVDMLVYQAARQFRLWTGGEAPVAQMAGAARAALRPA